MATIRPVFSCIEDFVKLSQSMTGHERDEVTREMYKTTNDGDDFHGKNKTVMEKYMQHLFEPSSSLLSGVIDELNGEAFVVDKWRFANHLEDGEDIDIARYLDGNDRFYSGVRRRRRELRTIRVYASIGGNCHLDKEELAIPGALATCVCEALESAGHAVEMWGCWSVNGFARNSKGNEVDMVVQTRIKAANAYADYGLINFVTGDHHFFRNIAFRTGCKYVSDNTEYKVTRWLGRAGQLTAETIGLDESECEAAVIIPPIYDLEEAKAWLAKFYAGRKDKEV